MARKDFIFGERVLFSFRNQVAELEVKKMKRDRGPNRDYGKIEWVVTKVSIPGCAVTPGTILTTRRVYHLARDIDPMAAHAFDMDNQR